jgi:hypothetical protein
LTVAARRAPLEAGIELAVRSIDRTLAGLGTAFPHVTEAGRWQTLETGAGPRWEGGAWQHGNWTAGFWVGCLWLAALCTGDKRYPTEAPCRPERSRPPAASSADSWKTVVTSRPGGPAATPSGSASARSTVPYWDFDDPAIPSAPRDSSALAIAIQGLLELAELHPSTAQARSYRSEAERLLGVLTGRCQNQEPDRVDGVLLHGCYSRTHGEGVDAALIWGDFFYLYGLIWGPSRPAARTEQAWIRGRNDGTARHWTDRGK